MNYSGLHDDQLLPPDGSNGGLPPGGLDGFQDGMFPEGEFHPMHHVMVDGGDRFGVSAVAFDGQEELLWMGNQGGHVTSYYGLGMQKYTSFQVHARDEIRQLLTIDSRILTLTRDSLRCSSKFGLKQFQYMGESVHDMQCMLQTGASSVVLGGHQTRMLELDIDTQQELRQVEVDPPGCAILKYSNKFICAGDSSGKVTLRDPHSLKAEHVLKAHSASLSDFDIHGYQLITCGFSNRMGSPTVDRFLMIYDLRVMRPMAPMQLMMEPLFLRIVPTYTDRICVVSQSGQFQLLEQGAMTPSSMMMYQIHTEGAPIGGFDIGASCNAIAFGDHGGYLHLYTNSSDVVFNPYSTETEFPHMEHIHPISFTDDLTPYSIIPMQYPGTGKLMSDWPYEYEQCVYRKAPQIDPDILRATKYVQNIGYAPNPGSKRRNQCPYKISSSQRQSRERKISVPDSPLGRGEDPFISVPKRYRKVEIKYSKLGVEDFDFRHYNKTNFAGLETHIPNAYCNAMLQVLYFIEPLRNTVLSHLCEKEFCLTCELSFLFHMLDTQKGRTCQANNFLRGFRTIPEASALGLLLAEAEETSGKVNFARLIQNFNRFILQQIHAEFIDAEREAANLGLNEKLMLEATRQMKISPVPGQESSDWEEGESSGDVPTPITPTSPFPESLETPEAAPDPFKDSIITKLFGTDLVNQFRCRCGEEMKREMKSTLFDLQYPDITSGKGPMAYTFAQVVQQSMALEQNTQAWCNKCNRYQPHRLDFPSALMTLHHLSKWMCSRVCCTFIQNFSVQTKQLRGLPDILAFNCHLENQRDFEFWRYQEEYVRKKAKEEAELQNQHTTPVSNVKMCRYGNACKRTDCRFRHENDKERNAQFRKENDEGLDMKSIEDGTEAAWVPLGLKLRLSPTDGTLCVENIEDETPINHMDGFAYYEILATVSAIRDSKTGGNLVSQVKVCEAYHQRKERVTCTQWYLFNDFSIIPIEKFEAIHFNLDWKVPCVFYFVRRDINMRYSIKAQNPISSEALFQNASLVTPRRKHVTFTPLDDDELPKEGDVVGLDAEFVTLNQEEAELRSDGTRSTIKPSQMSVARVTCTRGKGALEGEPFMDDYISTQEQVVDYLTQFSGIKPGDLDASISSKHLTTLKSTYIKLRYLVDEGVIFVGHGLKKDFRVINLIVPKDQVIDTVELFHLPRQRMISLKFLAWYFLGINIQSAMHDSIEDARTALKLYNKYQELSKNGMDTVRDRLKDMYSKGRDLQWKIPGASSED